METEKFEQAKKVKENLDKLGRQKYKLESAFKSCALSVTIEFNRPGGFIRKDEVSFRVKKIRNKTVPNPSPLFLFFSLIFYFILNYLLKYKGV
jgi:hypothetical protein